MKDVKYIFQLYLKSKMYNQWNEIAHYINEDTQLEDINGIEKGLHEIQNGYFDDSQFNFKTSIMTNTMCYYKDNKTYLFSQVNHLYGIEKNSEIYILNHPRDLPIGTEIKENNEFYSLVYGGKYIFIYNNDIEKIDTIQYFQEYAGGNTYILRNVWSPSNTNHYHIDNTFLYGGSQTINEAIYKYFWSLDTKDIRLFKENTTSDVFIETAMPTSNKLLFNHNIEEFMKEIQDSYDQNYHAVYITQNDKINQAVVYRLRQENTGNKWRGAKDKYTVFFNEVYDIQLKKMNNKWKISRLSSRRVEVPIQFGYDVLDI